MKALPRRSIMRGHALITGLILSIILMILSLAGFDTASLESRMASEFQQRGQLFQRAESALRYAEKLIVPQLEINLYTVDAEQQTTTFEIPANEATESSLDKASFANPVVNIKKLDTAVSKVRGKTFVNRDNNASRFILTAIAEGRNPGSGITLTSVVVRKAQSAGYE